MDRTGLGSPCGRRVKGWGVHVTRPVVCIIALGMAAVVAAPALGLAQARRGQPDAVRINPDLDTCEVTGSFALGGGANRVAKALVYNPRNNLVYTPLDGVNDIDLASRIVDGPARDQVIRACNEFAAKARGTAGAQAYERSIARGAAMEKAERSRAEGQSVPPNEAVLPPGGSGAGGPAIDLQMGPSAAAARAATQVAMAPPDAPEVITPGIVLPRALRGPAEEAIGQRLRQGVDEALLRSPDIDAARRDVTAANHLYQAAMRDKLNPDIQFETVGGMSHGRRGPALQTSDDLDPATGQRTQTTNDGVRGFVRPGVTVSLPVYDAGEREAKKTIAGIEVDSGSLSVDDKRAETAAILRQLYYEWRVSRAYIGLIQQWRPMFDEWFVKIDKLEKVKLVTYQDLMLARAVDEHYRERMDAICHDLALREKIWEQMVGQQTLRLPSDRQPLWCGLPPGSRAMPKGAPVGAIDDPTLSHWPALPAYPSDQQLDAMIERTPTVQIAANDIKKQREKAAIAESQQMPRLYAEAHARRTMPGLENTIGDSDNFVGMRFTMPLFDNFVRSSKSQSEIAAIGAAEARLIAVREKLRRDLRLLTAELARLGNLQAAQVETVRAAAIRLKNGKFRFEELGSKEQKELMLANLDYLRTFERSDDTIRQYFTVYNRLLRALGTAGADWVEG